MRYWLFLVLIIYGSMLHATIFVLQKPLLSTTGTQVYASQEKKQRCKRFTFERPWVRRVGDRIGRLLEQWFCCTRTHSIAHCPCAVDVVPKQYMSATAESVQKLKIRIPRHPPWWMSKALPDTTH